MNLDLDVKSIIDFDVTEYEKLQELIYVFKAHQPDNDKKDRYYEGHITVKEVNLGIALPETIKNLEIGCEWGNKCCDVLASRSMFDGYVGANGSETIELSEIVDGNRLISEYMKACKDELKFGCTFATLSADEELGCRIRFHSPQTAAALWNGEKGRIDCGFAIVDTVKDEKEHNIWNPSLINYYTDNAVWELERQNNKWYATRHEHIMNRPLMEALIWNATSKKPFGRSRIKASVRHLIEGFVRTVANASIGLEFATSPQKYLLGLTDDQYDALINQKFRQYVGSILLSTSNPDDGSNPDFGQLSQGNIQPHVEMLRMLSTQFSAATGLSVTDTGVVNDANPTSSDAIFAQSQTLISLAEQLNTGNGDALKVIAQMALAIKKNVSIKDLSLEEKDVIAHFKNPAMPSIATTADAAIKIASARPDFAKTDVFMEMIGFDQADIRRIKAQEQRSRGTDILFEEFSDA